MTPPDPVAIPTPLEIGRVQWWLDTIVAMASALRDAGISSVSVGEFAATLLPKQEPAPTYDDIKNEAADEPRNPFEDPASYPGGVVPGFVIERLPTEE